MIGPKAIQLIRLLLIGIGAVQAITSSAHAQDADADAEQAPIDARPVNTFELDASHVFALKNDENNTSSYRIAYLGNILGSKGSPAQPAAALDLEASAAVAKEGDKYDFTFRLEDGSASVDGGLAEVTGTLPLPLRGIEALNLRGTAFAGGDIDGKRVQIAVGVETPPAHLSVLSHHSWSNWLIFGLNGQRQEDTDGTQEDGDFGLVTYRAFVGKWFGWRQIADPAGEAARLADQILAQAPTLADAQDLAEKIRKIPALKRTDVQQLILNAIDEVEDNDGWKRAVYGISLGTAQRLVLKPTLAVYAESTGYYPFAGDDDLAASDGFKNLATLTLDYRFLPTNDDVLLRVRYENGHQRAVPESRRHQAVASIVVRF